MDIQYTLHGIIFEWDSQKAIANLRKHGISFEQACEAFFDPFLNRLEDEIVDNELRERFLGISTNWKVIYIVYVQRAEKFRIISARLATPAERETYENR
ncbi:MAG: BrnT family toxin [Anaerolineales bacterium]|nr:BrnT family toxin [Anaerolineales bacterium]MCZ2287229.1 BrnT family toxin [Anaerolineales bacterium]